LYLTAGIIAVRQVLRCVWSQVGVHEVGVRRAILQEIENFVAASKVDEVSWQQHTTYAVILLSL